MKPLATPIARAVAARSAMTLAILFAALVCLAPAAVDAVTDPKRPPGPVDHGQDLRIIKQRLLQQRLDDRAVNAAKVRAAVESLRDDGSWSDIDYSSATGQGSLLHLKRVVALARAFLTAGSPLRGDPAVRHAAQRAFDYWLNRNFPSSGFLKSIGIPLALSEAALLLEGDLSPGQRETARRRLQAVGRPGPKTAAQNLIWMARINARAGLFADDPQRVALGYRYIEQAIDPTSREGIQHDFSFHQHGMLYSFGYGAGTMTDLTRAASLLAGTGFAFSPERIGLLNAFLLDGQRWMVRGRSVDYGSMGRWIARQKARSAPLAAAARRMLPLAATRKDELQALIDHIEGTGPDSLDGNKHFWRSDFMAHHRPGYYASARMYSARIRNTDDPHHGEGLKSHHIADGANFLMITGEEYRGLAPVWDWQKIPGTTVVQTGTFPKTVARRGQSAFVGGVSDGRYGLAAFDFVRDGLRARKAWFFSDRAYAALGTGISSTDRAPVVTTINQSRLNGPVFVVQEGAPTRIDRSGRHSLANVRSVYHDRVGYLFPTPVGVFLANREQTGSWHSINRRRPDRPEKADVFSLWLDHGAAPRDGSYQYIVLPGVSLEEVSRGGERSGLRILGNTPALQAVRDDASGVAAAAFYQPGEVALFDGLPVRVDTPSLVLVRTRGAEIAVSVSDPENRKKIVTVEIGIDGLHGPGIVAAGRAGWSTMVFELPSGPWAGSTVTKQVVRR